MRDTVDPAVTDKLCAIREKVASRIGASRFRTWFGNSTDLRLDGQTLDVLVTNPFVGNWISTNYMPHLIAATREVVGTEPQVAVHIDPEAVRGSEGDAPGSSETQAPAAPRPADAAATPRPKPRSPQRPALRGEFESFVVGPSNELAFSIVSSLARNPRQAFKHLVLHGGCGLGKTHLLQAICNGIDRYQPGLEWRYLSGEEFTNEFIYAVKGGRIDNFRARFRNVDLLVIDDIHFLANKKATQEEFLHTFNAIDASGKTVVLSSDRHPRTIATLSEPLIDRLIASMVVEVQPPDFATRREILRRRALAMQCTLTDELLDFLAQRITRNVRELEGALYKLTAYASLTKERVTLDMARHVVEDYVAGARPPEATEIERGVAEHFGVSREALRSNSRDRTVTHARATAMYLIRQHTRMSFPEIGRLLGNKQHSTVLMAVRRVQELLAKNAELSWKTPAGLQQATMQNVIDRLEQRLLRNDCD